MSLLRRVLGRLNRTDVGDGRGDVFFARYDLLKTRWGSVYLHEFFRSDNERCLHDHPWSFATIILRGGYWEEIPEQHWVWTLLRGWHKETLPPHWFDSDGPGGLNPTALRWRRPGYVGFYRAEHAHRIELDPDRPRPWSLVLVGRKSRAWGFWTVNGWRAWVKGQGNPICGDERP